MVLYLPLAQENCLVGYQLSHLLNGKIKIYILNYFSALRSCDAKVKLLDINHSSQGHIRIYAKKLNI